VFSKYIKLLQTHLRAQILNSKLKTNKILGLTIIGTNIARTALKLDGPFIKTVLHTVID